MWSATSPDRNQRQTAYRILVAGTREQLEADQGDLWDSGVTRSSAMSVEYAGTALHSMQQCWWKARAWDAQGREGPWSEPASFEMALLSPSDWTAPWMGYPGAWPGKALYFRREFTLTRPIKRARVYMAGLGWSELHVNGRKVNDRVLDPPQSNYSKRVIYSTDAVESFLQPGKNVIGVICGNGWHACVRLLLQLHVEYEDGETAQLIPGDQPYHAWQVGTGPILENSVYDGEVYDARLEMPGWDEPGGRITSKSIMASVIDGPSGARVAASLEPIRVMKTLTAQTITQPQPGVYVFDMGRNLAGWARICVSGPRGSQVRLRYAESLYDDGDAAGTVNQENLIIAGAEDNYILKGEGEETWEPRFTYHGFRYVQVEGWPGEPAPDAVQARLVRSAVEPSGAFECSSDLLNRIYEMVHRTEESNLHSLPTDCPQRSERMGWLNDIAARAEGAVYNFDLARLYSKWIGDIADEQDPQTGAITDTAPFRWGKRPADPVSVCYLLVPWLLYTHYGDTHTLAERYTGMKAWVDYLTTRAEDGIVSYSSWGDWSPPIAFGIKGSDGDSAVSRDTPAPLVSTACYAYSARLLAQIAGVLANEADRQAYAALADEIAERFNKRFWNKKLRGYGSGNQSCNAIAAYMGLVPPERCAQVLASLVENVTGPSHNHLTTGNICTKYLLEVLSAGGRADVALGVALQETYPSWGYMLANGATTLWERWEHATGKAMNSHNHPMMGSVAAWLYRVVAGIQVEPDGAVGLTSAQGPGFERFMVCPGVMDQLTHARAALKTVKGKIEVAWSTENGQFTLDLSVPVGSQARVVLPLPTGATLYEGEDVVWRDEKSVSLRAHRTGGPLELSVGSGAWHFRSH
jgi:alpha-L-rhamnosidase